MNKRKLMTIALSVCIVAILAVGGSLAYLTDDEAVKNVFTIGKIDITLFESAVKPVEGEGDRPYGYVDADGEDKTETENEYVNLVPGSHIVKDPTVTNISEPANDAYIRVTIKHNNNAAIYNAFADQEDPDAAFMTMMEGLAETLKLCSHYDVAWKLTDGTEGANEDNYNTYELENDEKVYVLYFDKPLAKDEYIDVFTGIQIPAWFDEADLKAFEDLEINITADAIQADGFANVKAAFAAFDEERAGE